MKEQAQNIVGHLRNIKSMWDNPDVETPGKNIEEFAATYAKSLGKAPVSQAGPVKTDVLGRYMSYFGDNNV